MVSGSESRIPRSAHQSVAQSKCFALVDRGKGLAAAQAERALAGDGEFRGGSNVGKGQMKAADYVLVPDIVNQNAKAGGKNIGGLVGGLVGGMAKPGKMYEQPNVKATVVRDLDSGMTLYPIGEKEGIWWKVSDELGNEGWVPSPLFQLAK